MNREHVTAELDILMPVTARGYRDKFGSFYATVSWLEDGVEVTHPCADDLIIQRLVEEEAAEMESRRDDERKARREEAAMGDWR